MAIRLENNLKIPAGVDEIYTFRLFRKPYEEGWQEVVYRRSEAIEEFYVDGELVENYSDDWFLINVDGDIILTGDENEGQEIEEFIIFYELIDVEEIERWANDKIYFYKEIEDISYDPPKNIEVEVI